LKTRRKKGNENQGQSLDIGRWNWGGEREEGKRRKENKRGV
jgi:hypothetical protein